MYTNISEAHWASEDVSSRGSGSHSEGHTGGSTWVTGRFVHGCSCLLPAVAKQQQDAPQISQSPLPCPA